MLHSYYLNNLNNTEKYKNEGHSKLYPITWMLNEQPDISLFNGPCAHTDTYMYT